MHIPHMGCLRMPNWVSRDKCCLSSRRNSPRLRPSLIIFLRGRRFRPWQSEHVTRVMWIRFRFSFFINRDRKVLGESIHANQIQQQGNKKRLGKDPYMGTPTSNREKPQAKGLRRPTLGRPGSQCLGRYMKYTRASSPDGFVPCQPSREERHHAKRNPLRQATRKPGRWSHSPISPMYPAPCDLLRAGRGRGDQ
jgi:hypothetical protein